MEKLDLKDRKILYELDLNCRQSNTQIGKKVGLSRKVVEYRIKRMEEEGIINCYWSIIDTFKLGYIVFRIYIKYQDIPKEQKQRIINYFSNYKNIWVAYSIKGAINLGVVLWVKNIYEFYKFWEKTKEKYGNYLGEHIISLYIQADEYEKTYLISEEIQNKERTRFTITCTGDFVTIDNIDYRLLNEIVSNARIPLIQLSQKLNCSSQNVSYRLNKLIKTGVIKGFRIELDPSKLGFNNYSIKLTLKDYSKRKKIINKIQKNPFFKCLNTAIGYKDVEMEFILHNMDELTDIIDNLELQFPNTIRSYMFWSNQITYKERWLPEMTEADFKKK